MTDQDRYAQMIKGKRCIFVGGCPNIKGMNLGSFIDDYDVVIKSGGSLYLQDDKDYSKDFGSRIDSIYFNNQFLREMKPFPIDLVRKHNIKAMTFKSIGKNFIDKYPDIIIRDIKKIIKIVQCSCRSASYGPMIYLDILQYKPKEFFITGVDFFSSKKANFEHDNYQEYLPGYLPDKIRHQGNRINKGKKKDGHSFIGNAQYIMSLFKEYKNLKTHDFIFDILQGIVEGRIEQK